jgi:serine/threonine protein kinase
MPLDPGTHLGPYEILSQLGAGGMGEVYRARDPRLGRDVAIKVSAEKFNERFEREAKVVASLNHPNICALYDIGPNYIVMELVEGESPKGPMALDEALEVCRQIAAALEAAHEKGIVHRDLKPANIKVTPTGTVKVLDFGLAKVGPTSTSAGLEADATQSPTISMHATQAGMILGTAGYMAPEQAKGKSADKRGDARAAYGEADVHGRDGDRYARRRGAQRAETCGCAQPGAAPPQALSGERSTETVARYRRRDVAVGR